VTQLISKHQYSLFQENHWQRTDILFSVGIYHKLKFQQEIVTNRWCETFLTLIIEKSSQNIITCPLTYKMSQNNHLHKVMILPKGNFAANTDTLKLTWASSTVATTCSYPQLLCSLSLSLSLSHTHTHTHTHTHGWIWQDPTARKS